METKLTYIQRRNRWDDFKHKYLQESQSLTINLDLGCVRYAILWAEMIEAKLPYNTKDADICAAYDAVESDLPNTSGSVQYAAKCYLATYWTFAEVIKDHIISKAKAAEKEFQVRRLEWMGVENFNKKNTEDFVAAWGVTPAEYVSKQAVLEA